MKDAPAIAARRIVQKFGGPATLARYLSIDGNPVPASTVQSWQNAGIPVKWHHPVILAGARAAVPIEPEDFFEPVHSLATAVPAEAVRGILRESAPMTRAAKMLLDEDFNRLYHPKPKRRERADG
jgi:hypothetical protein